MLLPGQVVLFQSDGIGHETLVRSFRTGVGRVPAKVVRVFIFVLVYTKTSVLGVLWWSVSRVREDTVRGKVPGILALRLRPVDHRGRRWGWISECGPGCCRPCRWCSSAGSDHRSRTGESWLHPDSKSCRTGNREKKINNIVQENKSWSENFWFFWSGTFSPPGRLRPFRYSWPPWPDHRRWCSNHSWLWWGCRSRRLWWAETSQKKSLKMKKQTNGWPHHNVTFSLPCGKNKSQPVSPAWASSTLQSSPCVLERTQAAAVYHSSSYRQPSDETVRRMGALSRSPAGQTVMWREQQTQQLSDSVTWPYLVYTWGSGWFGTWSSYRRRSSHRCTPVWCHPLMLSSEETTGSCPGWWPCSPYLQHRYRVEHRAAQVRFKTRANMKQQEKKKNWNRAISKGNMSQNECSKNALKGLLKPNPWVEAHYCAIIYNKKT